MVWLSNAWCACTVEAEELTYFRFNVITRHSFCLKLSPLQLDCILNVSTFSDTDVDTITTSVVRFNFRLEDTENQRRLLFAALNAWDVALMVGFL